MLLRGGLKYAFLALGATVMLTAAASRASASCGDYVMIGGKHHSHSDHDSKPEDSKSPAGKSQEKTPCPCHGSQCSQAPLPWSPPPSVQLPGDRDHLLACRGYQASSQFGRLGAVSEFPFLCLSGAPTDVFRPPQFSA